MWTFINQKVGLTLTLSAGEATPISISSMSVISEMKRMSSYPFSTSFFVYCDRPCSESRSSTDDSLREAWGTGKETTTNVALCPERNRSVQDGRETKLHTNLVLVIGARARKKRDDGFISERTNFYCPVE